MARPTWRNWARNQRSHAPLAEPRTRDELMRAVAGAARPGAGGERRRVRASGGRYSWSPLVPGCETIVSTARLGRVLDFDRERGLIRAEAGATIRTLDRAARRGGWTLRSPTLFPFPTLAGALAVGAHHTNRHVGCLSDSLCELEIVGAEGDLRTLRRGDPAFAAAQVSLGTFGVVYAATLALEPLFPVYRDLRRVPLADALDGMLDLEACTEFLELFWWPFQDTIWVYRMSRTDDPPDRETWDRELFERFDTRVEWFFGGKILPRIAGRAPGLTPLISKAANALANQPGVRIMSASDAFHFQKAYPKNWDMQLAVPVEHAARAFRDAIALVSQHARAGLYPLNLALHARFSGASEAWLSPAHGRRTCHIEAVTVQTTRGWREFFQLLEERWLEIDGARPHWGKLFWRTDVPARAYARWEDFRRVRREWDPRGVFLNDWLEQHVGL